MTEHTGRLITLEGGEGAGKSTLAGGLQRYFAERQWPAVFTREPGGTAVGEAIRAIFLDHASGSMDVRVELLLMFAARVQHVEDVIKPALAAGKWVVCDRFTDASYAYQGGGRGMDAKAIEALEAWALGTLQPDLTLLLDMPVAAGRARVNQRGAADRIEYEQDAFFERVRHAYHQRAQAAPARFVMLDATQDAATLLRQAEKAIAQLEKLS